MVLAALMEYRNLFLTMLDQTNRSKHVCVDTYTCIYVYVYICLHILSPVSHFFYSALFVILIHVAKPVYLTTVLSVSVSLLPACCLVFHLKYPLKTTFDYFVDQHLVALNSLL